MNWEQLEAELKPAEDRADAIYWNEVEQTAADIGQIVAGLIPKGVTFAPIVRHHPELAADGRPMVTTHDEMHAITLDDPEIAETVARLVDWNTQAERQQLDLDIEDANRAGDAEKLSTLAEASIRLDEKAYKLECYSVLSALHPFSRSYVKEHITTHPGAANSVDEQVRFLMYADEEKEFLSKELRKYNPRQIDFWRSEVPDNPVELRSLDQLEEHMENQAVKLAILRKIISDVITGEAAIEYDFEESRTWPNPPEVSREAIEVVPFYDVLKNLPGVDPVLYVTKGRLKDLPRSGWIVHGKLGIGDSGGMDIYRIEEGGMRLQAIWGGTGSDTAGAHFEFGSGKYSHYMLSYQH